MNEVQVWEWCVLAYCVFGIFASNPKVSHGGFIGAVLIGLWMLFF